MLTLRERSSGFRLWGGATQGVHVEGRATRLFTIGGDSCDVGKHCVNYKWKRWEHILCAREHVMLGIYVV